MSIFGSIMSALVSHAEAAALPPQSRPAQPAASPASAPHAAAPAAGNGHAPAPSAPSLSSVAASAVAAAPAAASAVAGAVKSGPVDVGAVLTKLAAANGGGGNWQTSIVDLLKLLNLDSSLAARKELATELNVHVGQDGSAEENIALHKAVMQKIADNGGTVPASLRG